MTWELESYESHQTFIKVIVKARLVLKSDEARDDKIHGRVEIGLCE